jgi:LacI family transcriptional regulator
MTIRRTISTETGVNIYNVAEKAGVSTATVSRVLNGNPKVDPTLKQRVLSVIKELKYVPNGSARSLVTKRTKRIALLISDITNPFFSQAARGAQDTLDQSDYQLLLANSDNQPNRELRNLITFAQTGVDGILIEPAILDKPSSSAQGNAKRNLAKQLEQMDLPVVGLTPDLVMPNADSVSIDEELAAFKAMDHLLSLGHQKIALINGPKHSSIGSRRTTGYEQALKQHGLPIRPEIMYFDHFQKETGIAGTTTLLEQHPEISAIFAADELIANGVIQAARILNLQIPQDLALACIGDGTSTAESYPPITVAAHPRGYEFGRISSQMLLERITGQHKTPLESRGVILETRLIVRVSTVANLAS